MTLWFSLLLAFLKTNAVIRAELVTHLLTEGDKTNHIGKRCGDATKNFQSMKAVAMQEPRHGKSVPIAKNVKTNTTFVSPASEKSMKIWN